ncbi:MAG TPA: GAF domain-containing protein [Acidobacteriota bacterium]|nr:GAF domain-containing protein [Acidobacteriota bacterium]
MKKLLLVDDDPFSLKLLEDLFKKDWRIINETTIERILDQCKKDPPSLILLNGSLRRTAGESTFIAVREAVPEIPVVVYTPSNMVKLGREMVKRGAFWNLTTPLNTTDLEHIMDIAIQIQDYRQRVVDSRRDFEQLEEGIARISVPLQDNLPAHFTFDQDELLQSIVDLLADVLQVETVSLMLLDSRTGELRIKAAKGLSSTVIRNTVKRIGEGISGWVVREGKPLYVKNVEKDENFTESPYFEQYSSKSLVCVPVKAGNRVIGVLNANNKWNGEPFEEHELYLVTIFAHILLLTIMNAQLHFDRERVYMRETRLSQMHRKITATLEPKTMFHTTLDECCSTFEADSAFLFLLDEKAANLSGFCYSGNIFTESTLSPNLLRQWLSRRHEPVIVTGEPAQPEFQLLTGITGQEIRCWISVPLIIQEKMVGSLELASSDPKRFREADKQSLSRVGQHAALAINNARLYEKLLNSIKEISEARKEVARVRRGQYL